jgi:hypothetical protein
MAIETRAQLTVEAEQIRDEVIVSANTATRVGSHMINGLDSAPVRVVELVPPATAPEAPLDLYLDLNLGIPYIATDSAVSTDFKRLALFSDINSIDPNAIHVNTPGEIAAIANKAAPIGADYLVIEDSEDSNNKKHILLSTLPAPSGTVLESDFDANTILAATADDTPLPLTIPEQTIVGRITAGNIDALTATEVRTLINVEDGADVTDAENIEDAITGASADTLTDASIIPFVKAATLVKITWLNIKATLKTYFDTLYAPIAQTTAENLALSGAENLDLSTFDSFEGLLTGNTTLSVTNTPAVGVTFTRNLIISGNAGTETLTLPGTWNVYGTYDVATINYLTIEFANFTTNGLQVNCFINQPN